jgi:PAS domain S-box-containing protein
MISIGIIDYFLPLGVAFGTLYLIPTFLIFHISDRNEALKVVCGCVLLVIAGGFYSPDTPELWKAIFNRLLSIGGLCLTYYLGVKNMLKNESNIILINQLGRRELALNSCTLISETDSEGIITYVNDLFCTVSKYSRDELIGKTHKIVSSGVHQNNLWKECWDTIGTGSIFKGEICNKSKDGSLHWFETIIFPKLDSKKSIIGYTAVRVDITEKKEAKSQLIHQSKLSSIGEMASNVGHEINNPLAISAGNVSLIERELQRDNYCQKTIYQRLDKIKQGHERIRNIVDGLRTFARSDSDNIGVVSFPMVINTTVSFLREIYEADGINVRIELPTETLYLEANIGKLQQIMMNFISNANDATSGQERREINLSLKKKDESNLIFSVTDNGSGMSDEVKNKVLEPYFTTKAEGDGTGIGLGLVASFVKEMNGEIEIESEIGIGSTFSVTFPMIGGTTIEQEQLKGTALVVDDDDDIRSILIELLEGMGLLVDEADDGETALEKVKLKRYDYICTDMEMKRMHGIEFIKESRNLPNGNTNIFIITGGVNTKDRENLRKTINGYITKPFTTEKDLYEALVNPEIEI